MARTTTKKEPLQEAALQLFVEKGIAGTTTREIAEKAGIAEGTIYRHYPGKDALAWDLFSRNFMKLAVKLDRLQSQEPTLKDKIFKMVDTFFSLYDEDKTLFQYILLSQHDLLRRVPPEMPNPTNVVVTMVREAMERKEIKRGDPELAAALLMGIVLQTTITHIYGRIDGLLINLTDEITEACWRALEK